MQQITYLKSVFDTDGSDEFEVDLHRFVDLSKPLLSTIQRLLRLVQSLGEVKVPETPK
jgi:hypothetical protein